MSAAIVATIILSNLVSSVKRYLRPIVSLFSTALLISPLSAHPGHGDGGAAHYLATPEHVLPILLAFALMILTFAALFRTRFAKSIANR
ncbi:hypothetical protein OAF37_03005 [Rubripirellula sp.]|nr:hypothetical protein [Rubripirellula sp.]MDB4645006.1 hypothetical protein [Rubripirellula sp.]